MGRLRPGTIRSGDIYNLESWQDVVVVVEVAGSGLRPPLRETLAARGIEPDPARTYTVATTGYVADELASRSLGPIRGRRRGRALREGAVDYLSRHGFPRHG